jgi:hypothetical protein
MILTFVDYSRYKSCNYNYVTLQFINCPQIKRLYYVNKYFYFVILHVGSILNIIRYILGKDITF